ncbi:glutathione S-transferase [Zoogloea sp.]|uniref:glutathione S-transferase n=1 Tax=Zoogloea sp. TaxID=49181 RepID=UPI0026207F95|nr:glutathione S-transferase [Zoogloea sp.]MDD3352405.1 glutathione S-transferase [Zoogloea sp.]
MKLVASLTSPYARKIRVALAEKGLPFTLEVDIPWLAETSVPDYNPLGKVPALVADDGEVWFDSPVIADYLETLGGPALIPADRLAALPVRQSEALADGLTDAAVTIFLETRRPEAQQDPATIERQITKIHRGLAALELRVSARKGLGGSSLTIGDIAAACALAYLDFRLNHLVWRSAHPELAAWAATVLARPSFLDTTPPAA